MTGSVRAAAAGIVLVAAGCGGGPGGAAGAPYLDTAAFVAMHWPAVPTAGIEEAVLHSLEPADCGACHKTQFDDWRASLHSQAMGPGVTGQFPGMDDSERRDCQRCHAPLREQLARDAPLASHGLACAACHVRAGRVFGPPRRDGSAPLIIQGMPHGGWTPVGAFEDSRFCMRCHQFAEDGYALNGKMLENTYVEWKESRHARERRPCQACHMPERRHLWRGIHDPATTRAAIVIEPIPVVNVEGRLNGGWRITNSGAGHFFPTYVTPRIVATIRQEDAAGRGIEGTAIDYVLAREVTPDLTEELFDTRIAPDEARALLYDRPLSPGATHLALAIRVAPDAFYSRLYRSLLDVKDGLSNRRSIEEAFERSVSSQYVMATERQLVRSTGVESNALNATRRSGSAPDPDGRG